MKKINIKIIFIKFIKIYQLIISPYLGNNCRFYPSCSDYTVEAIEKYGMIKGLKMMTIRILRCNPWGGSGIDMVNDKDVKN